MLFGIPGSGSMAVFLGGLTLLGIEPGPSLIEENLKFTYVMVWSLALANVVGAGLCFALSNKVAKITTIPYGILAPFMIMIVCFAAFQVTRSIYDIYTLVVLGAICTLMKNYNWPRPALLIGFVLSDTLETYLYQAVQFYDWNFLLRPGVIIIFIITILSVYLGARNSKKITTNQTIDIKDLFKPTVQNLFIGILYCFFGFAVFDSFQHNLLGGIFPGGISIIMFATLNYAIFVNKQWLSASVQTSFSSDETVDLFKSFSWILLLVFLNTLFGFVISIFVFFIVIMKNKTNLPNRKIIIISISALAFMLMLSHFMVLDFPPGLLQYFMKLPWPLN